MKKLISFVLIIALTITTSVIITATSKPTHNLYSIPNALYLDGEVITPEDQFIWGYEDDDIPVNTVVTVIFDDNGTPSYLEDDCIVNCIIQH